MSVFRLFAPIFAAGVALSPVSAESEQRFALSGFDSISLEGAYEMQVDVGPSYSVSVSGPEDRLRDAEVRVEDGRLVLSERECRGCRRRGVLAARITMPLLSGVYIAGVAEDSRISGIAGGDFRMDVSGVADIELAGRCDRFVLTVQGVSEIDGENFRCTETIADLDGVGEAAVYASRRLEADIDGMARLTVFGSPPDVRERRGGFARLDVR